MPPFCFWFARGLFSIPQFLLEDVLCRLCVGTVLSTQLLNNCYLLNGLRKRKESAFKLNKSRVPEHRHLGDRYIHIYIYTVQVANTIVM